MKTFVSIFLFLFFTSCENTQEYKNDVQKSSKTGDSTQHPEYSIPAENNIPIQESKPTAEVEEYTANGTLESEPTAEVEEYTASGISEPEPTAEVEDKPLVQ